MKKGTIILSLISVFVLNSVCIFATEQTEKLDHAIAEEARLQALLLRAQAKKKTAQADMEKQKNLKYDIDTIKVEIDQIHSDSKMAEKRLLAAKNEYNVAVQNLNKEESAQNPAKNKIETMKAKKGDLEQLIEDKKIELKQLEKDLTNATKRIGKSKGLLVNLRKKRDTKKRELEKFQSEVTVLKKESASLKKKLAEKEKMLK